MSFGVILTLSGAEIDCWTSRNILCEKNIKNFRMFGGARSCRKVKCIEGHIFPRSLLQTCRLERTSLCYIPGYL